MRDTPSQREIIVPGDMRASRGTKATPRRVPTARRRTASRSEAWATLGAVARSIGGLCVKRPGETAGSLVALGAAAYISINALGFQAGHHPAPILPQPKAEAQSKPAVAPVPAKLAADQPPTDKPASAAAEPSTSAPRDSIGTLIRSADETTASVTLKPEKAVMQAQRALSKLGYGPIKDDGVMGPGTKAAIEKFERDRKLPVKGEAAGRTLKELAARAAQSKTKG